MSSHQIKTGSENSTREVDSQKKLIRPKSAAVKSIDRSSRVDSESSWRKTVAVDLDGPSAIYSKRENSRAKISINRALQNFSREELYDKTISLKKLLNDANNERKILKAKALRLEEIINKRDKDYEDLMSMTTSLNSSSELARKLRQEENQVNSLKKLVRDMEKTTKQQTQEIFVLKNDMRYTRVNELERENKTYLQEILQLQRMVDNELNLIEGSDSFKKLRVNLMEAEQNLRNANANVHTLEDANLELGQRIQDLNSELQQARRDHDDFVNTTSLNHQEEELIYKSLLREKESRISNLSDSLQESELKRSELKMQIEMEQERKMEMQSRINELQTKKAELENERQDMSEKILSLEAKIEELNLRADKLANEIKTAQESEGEAQLQIKNLETVKEKLQASELDLIKIKNQLELQIESIKQTTEIAISDIQLEKQRAIKDLESKLASAERLAEIQEQAKNTLTVKNSNMSEEIANLKGQVDRISAKLDEKDKQIENMLYERQRHAERSLENLESQKSLKDDIETLKRKNAEQESQIEKERDRVEKLNFQLENWHQTHDNDVHVIEELQNIISSLKSEIETIKSSTIQAKHVAEASGYESDENSVNTFIVNEKPSKNSSVVNLVNSKPKEELKSQVEETQTAEPASLRGSKVRISEKTGSSSIHASKTQFESTKVASLTQLKSGNSGSKIQLNSSKTQLNGSKSALVSKSGGSMNKIYSSDTGNNNKSQSVSSLSKPQAASATDLSTTPRSASKPQVTSTVAKTSSRQDIIVEPTEI